LGVLSFSDEGKRRLNVSLTLAKRGLVVGGDWETLGTVGSHRSAGDSSAAVCAAHGDRLGVVTLSVRIGTESRDA
jgi:hypothetical protein